MIILRAIMIALGAAVIFRIRVGALRLRGVLDRTRRQNVVRGR